MAYDEEVRGTWHRNNRSNCSCDLHDMQMPRGIKVFPRNRWNYFARFAFFSPVAFIRLIRSATSVRKYSTMSTRSIGLQALRIVITQLSSSGDA